MSEKTIVKGADWLFLMLIVFHLGLSYAAGYMFRDTGLTVNQSIIFSQLMLIVPCGLYLLIRKINPIKFITFRKMDILSILMTMIFVVMIMPLVTVINAISMLFTENTVQNMASEMTENPFLLNILLMAVLPAFFEEFAFRGILYQSYKRKGIIYGAVLSGCLFGLMHLNFNQFSYALVLGILFALLIEATGSIWASMIGHFMINANSVIMLKVSEKMMEGMAMTEAGADYNQIMSNVNDTRMLQMVIIVYTVIACVTTALAWGIWVWLAKHNNNLHKFPMLAGISGTDTRNTVEKNTAIKPIRIVLVIGIAICLGFMIYYETLQ